MKKIILSLIASLLTCNSSFGMLLKQNLHAKKHLRTYTIKNITPIVSNGVINSKHNIINDIRLQIKELQTTQKRFNVIYNYGYECHTEDEDACICGTLEYLEKKIKEHTKKIDTQMLNLESEIIKNTRTRGYNPKSKINNRQLQNLKRRLKFLTKLNKKKLE